MKDADAWHIFCFGSARSVGTPPLVRLLLQFDQVLTRTLLRHHIAWLNAGLAEEATLGASASAWLFAILARLDMPISGDMAASLRQLLRRCCAIRAHLRPSQDYDCALACLNTIIVVVGDVFGQGGGDTE